jgi:hypothetical protein
LKPEDLVRVFTETLVRTLVAADAPKGPDLAQVAAVVDRRLDALLNNEPPAAPAASDLDRMFNANPVGWQEGDQTDMFANEQRASEQSPYKPTYRPDGDYTDGEEGPMTPWASP